jgi:hypothetical protein
MSASLQEVASYLGGLAVYMRNEGAEVPEPELDRYDDSDDIGFELVGEMPWPTDPKPAELSARELWSPAGRDRYDRIGYVYELIDRPHNRRRAFHLHDPEVFLKRLGVPMHEHCEEIMDHPVHEHYLGLPIANGYEALNALLTCFSTEEPFGCASLPHPR